MIAAGDMEQSKGGTVASGRVVLIGGTGSLASEESRLGCAVPCFRETKEPRKWCLLDEGCCNLVWSTGLAFLKLPTSSVLAGKLRHRNTVF